MPSYVTLDQAKAANQAASYQAGIDQALYGGPVPYIEAPIPTTLSQTAGQTPGGAAGVNEAIAAAGNSLVPAPLDPVEIYGGPINVPGPSSPSLSMILLAGVGVLILMM